MTTVLLASLPLQLLCHLIVPQARDFNATNIAVNKSFLRVELTDPTDGETAVPLADLPLQLVCDLPVTSDSSTTTSASIVTLPDGYVRFADFRIAYKIYKEKVNWNAARNRCILEGARLAIPDSIVKIAYINSLKTNWGNDWLHVGIYKSSTTNEWVRIDNGLPAQNLKWLPGYPLGSGKCAGISYSREGLVDNDCTEDNEYYVCEIPG